MMEEYFAGLMKLAEANIHVNEGDYEKDGLLYCGRCHTPKQGLYDMPWGTIKPYILCRCETERRDRERQEEKAREMAEKVRRYRKMGFPESEMEKWTFEADDQADSRISTAMRRYAENFQEMRKAGKGLLIFGNVGVGKSFYAACIVNALIDKGYPCMMTNFGRLTNTIQGMFEGRQEYIDSLNSFSLLAIDDLGVERGTEAMNEMVYGIIDSRYRAGLPLIVTTNLTAEELKKPADIRKARIYSRLMEMCIPLEVKGADRRRQALKADFAEFKSLLGL